MSIAYQIAKYHALISRDEVEQRGGKWSDEYACFIFPDGSAGAFTDLVRGASQRNGDGTPHLHFVEYKGGENV